MRRTIRCAAVGVVMISLVSSAQEVPAPEASAPSAAPELRGVWVTRFEWATPDPQECRERITRILDDIAERNFNAVVFQIRGEADTLYPSEMEPWSQLIGGKDPGFDPVALAIEEAHRRGLEFHAYMNPMPLRSLAWRGAPEAPNHLWHRHGPDSPEPWVCVDRDGKPAREEYYYLSAGVPGVHVYLRKVIMDVVRRYDVDGIHLDRIRYPGEEYSHDPISRRRWAGRGNPELLEYGDWQRRELTKLINDLAAEMRAEKPKVVLSCSAWGIYNRHHIEGYDSFSSGYHDFYQDTWTWCRIGAMDLLVPMIYWNLADPKPNYDEVVADFVRGVGGAHVAGGQRMFSPEENVRQVRLTREAGAAGTVLFSFRSARRRGVMQALHEQLYQEKAPTPVLPRIRSPETGTILGTVLGDDGQPLVDAWVSLETPRASEGQRSPRARRGGAASITWTSSADGRFAFHNVPPGEARVVVRYEGTPAVASEPISVQAGAVARVEVKVPGAAELRDQPFVTILRPLDGSETPAEVVHLLGRTTPSNRVSVAGRDVEVFATGAFAADNVPLVPGENRIEIRVTGDDRSLTRTLLVKRTETGRDASPAAPSEPSERRSEPAEEVWTGEKIRVAQTTGERTGITYGLHSVRLGGPWLAWVPKGTRFEVVGRQGRNLRIRLSASVTGWVAEGDIEWLPEGTPRPHNHFTACEVNGTDEHDVLSLGMAAPVVVAVTPEIDPSNRLIIDFYNTHHAATWLSHKSGARIIGPVHIEQVETDRVRLTLPIHSKQIWGYQTEIRDGRFTLRVRRPPTLATPPDSPLKGLLIAVEAGHGGPGNDGARGHMGTKEKTVNLAAALALQEELERRGARVVQVRRRDESVSLGERVARTNAAGADLFVSLHGNSAGSTRGYLSVSGTSTYYHGIHCQPMAKAVYDELLKLGWREFGVVGNFSYTPLRNTQVPSILVEQAFMSHPGDEARLLDPAYQQQQAAAIASGLEKFLEQARE